MKYMRKNSFVVCLVISAILLTSSFAMPVLAAENTGIETSSVMLLLNRQRRMELLLEHILD